MAKNLLNLMVLQMSSLAILTSFKTLLILKQLLMYQ